MSKIIPKQFHDDILGYECLCSKEFSTKYCHKIVTYRVAHLNKHHSMPKNALGKESDFETSAFAHLMLIVLKNETVCPHCGNVLRKYFNIDHPDFVKFACIDDDCRMEWKKKHGGGHFNSHKLVMPKKKFYCFRHLHNSDESKCGSCKMEDHFNKTMMPKINELISKHS